MSRRTPVPEDEAAAVWVPLDAIHPWAENPRDNAAAVAEVAKSIKRFGFASPIIARKADGEIIAGHTRYQAAKRLGLERVPVRYLDLDPADAHLLALADNRVGEIAEWSDGLAEVLRQLREEDQDLSGLGWSDAEIAALIDPEEPEEAPDQSALLDQGKYQIVVDCDDEHHQAELLERFNEEGLACRALMS